MQSTQRAGRVLAHAHILGVAASIGPCTVGAITIALTCAVRSLLVRLRLGPLLLLSRHALCVLRIWLLSETRALRHAVCRGGDKCA